MLSSFGYGRSEVVLAASFIGIGSIIGRLSTGILLDRFNGGLVGLRLIPIVASAMLLSQVQSIVAVSVAAFLFGYVAGAEMDVIAYVTSRYFCLRRYGRLVGVLGREPISGIPLAAEF
jgi:predicted MFS family arabinose efflux permease